MSILAESSSWSPVEGKPSETGSPRSQQVSPVPDDKRCIICLAELGGEGVVTGAVDGAEAVGEKAKLGLLPEDATRIHLALEENLTERDRHGVNGEAHGACVHVESGDDNIG